MCAGPSATAPPPRTHVGDVFIAVPWSQVRPRGRRWQPGARRGVTWSYVERCTWRHLLRRLAVVPLTPGPPRSTRFHSSLASLPDPDLKLLPWTPLDRPLLAVMPCPSGRACTRRHLSCRIAPVDAARGALVRAGACVVLRSCCLWDSHPSSRPAAAWLLSPALRAEELLVDIPAGTLDGHLGVSPPLSLRSESVVDLGPVSAPCTPRP